MSLTTKTNSQEKTISSIVSSNLVLFPEYDTSEMKNDMV